MLWRLAPAIRDLRFRDTTTAKNSCNEAFNRVYDVRFAEPRASTLGSQMKFPHAGAWRMPPNRVSAIAPESPRITQVQEEIVKRQLLNVFGKTSDYPVRDLSDEALLVEYIGHLTDY